MLDDCSLLIPLDFYLGPEPPSWCISWSLYFFHKWIDLTDPESRTLTLAELQVCVSSIMPWYLPPASAQIPVSTTNYGPRDDLNPESSRRLRPHGFLPGFSQDGFGAFDWDFYHDMHLDGPQIDL